MEVLFSLALAGISIAIMQSTLSQSIYTQKMLDGRVTAIVLGEGKLAELEKGSERSSSGDFPIPYANFKWIDQEDSLPDDSTQITLTVEWRDVNAELHQKVFMGRRQPE